MISLVHGGLRIELPEDWSDESTLLFVAPAAIQRTLTAQPSAAPTEAFSLRFVAARDRDARALIEEQTAEMSKTVQRFEVLAEGPIRSGLGEGWSAVQRFDLVGSTLRQIAAAFVIGRLALMATVSASDARFPKVEADLRRLLEALQRA